MISDGFFNFINELITYLEIFLGEPAADASRLKISMELFGEILIPSRIADEARMKLKLMSCR